MESASIYIQKKPYKNGLVPVFIRFIVSGKIYLKSICSAYEYQIDRKNTRIKSKHPDYLIMNENIELTLKEAQTYIRKCHLERVPVEPALFFNRSKGQWLSEAIRARGEVFEQNGSFNTAKKYYSVANKLSSMRYDIRLNDITHEWLDSYMQGLKQAGNKPVTVRKDLVIISATLNDLKAYNPVKEIKKPSSKGVKEKLTMHEFEKIRDVDLSGMEHTVRQMWVFAVYARGMRVFDLLTLMVSQLRGERIIYKAHKTGKEQNIPISPAMHAILDEMDLTGEYVFPLMDRPYSQFDSGTNLQRKRYQERANTLAYDMNVALKSIAQKAGIGKHITNHVARHTFAFLALKHRIDLGTLQNLLDHGDLQTTKAYAESIMSSDELDESVEGLFDK